MRQFLSRDVLSTRVFHTSFSQSSSSFLYSNLSWMREKSTISLFLSLSLDAIEKSASTSFRSTGSLTKEISAFGVRSVKQFSAGCGSVAAESVGLIPWVDSWIRISELEWRAERRMGEAARRAGNVWVCGPSKLQRCACRVAQFTCFINSPSFCLVHRVAASLPFSICPLVSLLVTLSPRHSLTSIHELRLCLALTTRSFLPLAPPSSLRNSFIIRSCFQGSARVL